jgi:short-subunit dehydrogenase
MMDVNRYGPWAVVAGGSEGVGAAFARQLADAGFNLVLIARKPGPLEAVAQEVRERSGREVRALALDLTRPEMLDRIREATDDVDVGLLIYNAGADHRTGWLLDGQLEDVLKVIRLNVVGHATLSYHFGKRLVGRGRGGIVIIGSLAGQAGGPSVVTYAGAKAFAQMFCEGLWWELRQRGVDVLYMPLGSTDTPAMVRLGIIFPPGEADDPAEVAALALANVGNGPVFVAPKYREMFAQYATPERRQAAEQMAGFLLAHTADAVPLASAEGE